MLRQQLEKEVFKKCRSEIIEITKRRTGRRKDSNIKQQIHRMSSGVLRTLLSGGPTYHSHIRNQQEEPE